MRTKILSFQFFIILFVILSLLIVKDDVVSIVKSASSYVRQKIEIPVAKFDTRSEIKVPDKVSTPGALRVVDNLINKNVKLSKNNVINITNQYRKENGNLVELKENMDLDASAAKKLKDMFDNQYFEHISPKTGLGVSGLANDIGYEYIIIGENLALGNFKNDQALVDAWMASPGHRANILNKNYREIGVAVGMDTYNSKNTWIAVQHFGTSRSLCPSIDKVLYGIIDINQNRIAEIEAELTIRREMIDKKGLYKGHTLAEQVDQYNSLVPVYNDLIKETKQKIEEYNNEVRQFNTCILGYQ